MPSSFVESLEPYVVLLYLVHVIISLFLAIFLTTFTRKRFIKGTNFIIAKDALRLKEIENRSLVFKLLFRVALHRNNRITGTLFLFLFSLATPLIGYFFAVWITYYIKNVKYDKRVANTNILNLDEFGTSFLKVERIFGEGSMNDLLTSEYAPKSKKLKALSSLSSNSSPQNLKVIRQTLSSTDDEIRMFGYAILNKAEKSLSIKINKHMETLNNKSEVVDEGEAEQERRANAAKELAHLYWEMVYTELSHESLKNNFLLEVIKYIKEAKKYYIPLMEVTRTNIDNYLQNIKDIKDIEEKKDIPSLTKTEKERLENGKIREQTLLEKERIILEKTTQSCLKLYILMGRVYMSQHEYENANTEFAIAQELNDTKSSFILPYLAEIYFLMGNYKVVKAMLKDADNLELNATLNPIIEQWKAA